MVCKRTKGGTSLKVVDTANVHSRLVDENGHDIRLEEIDEFDPNKMRLIVNYNGRTWELEGSALQPYIIIGEE